MKRSLLVSKQPKRANLSMETVVIAILALLVLAVLSFIFIDGVSSGKNDLERCELKGGSCVSSGSCQGTTISATCTVETQVCCFDRNSFIS